MILEYLGEQKPQKKLTDVSMTLRHVSRAVQEEIKKIHGGAHGPDMATNRLFSFRHFDENNNRRAICKDVQKPFIPHDPYATTLRVLYERIAYQESIHAMLDS